MKTIDCYKVTCEVSVIKSTVVHGSSTRIPSGASALQLSHPVGKSVC